MLPEQWTGLRSTTNQNGDGEVQYEVQAIRKHCVVHGEVQYLVKWVRYDESKNLWLTATQLDLAKEILEAYRRQNQLNSTIVYDIVKCAHCDVVHVDTGKYAWSNHIKHICYLCRRTFCSTRPCV